jgi:predicted DNA-binding transcriptional regulator YafY
VLETSARLLRLLSLLQIHLDWTGADLAARLGVTPRTVRRDIARLRELGYPVHAVPGVAGGYRLAAGASLPPLLLDDDEAVAVALSLRSAAIQSVAGVGEASVRALAKIDQVLPSRLRERAAAISQMTVPLAGAAPIVTAETLTAIARACRGRERLAFGYRNYDGETTQRLVEPYRLVQAGYRWYLVAHDPERSDWRTFRADRIDAPRLTGIRFVLADPPDAAALVARSVTTAPYRHQARIMVQAPADEVARLVPPTVGVLEPEGAERCVLTTGSDSLDAIAVHVAMLGFPVSVLEPAQLAERMRAIGDRLTQASRQQVSSDGL